MDDYNRKSRQRPQTIEIRTMSNIRADRSVAIRRQ
jgi:hypothetical protein